jgi:hypothetical protein
MKKFGPQFSLSFLVLAAAIALSCGSGAHIPQSVVVNPAAANAQDFPSGDVQFTATVYYNTKPSPVSPVAASWNVCSQQGPTDGVSVSNSGVAQCAAVARGTFTIYAFVPDPTFKGVCASSSLPCGGTCGGVVGMAQLTCP